MKIVTVCHRGNNRSAALAYLLRDESPYHHEVISYGPQSLNDKKMINILCDWADKIIVIPLDVDVPEQFKYKRIYFDLETNNVDIWGIGFNSDLLNKLRKKVKEVGL